MDPRMGKAGALYARVLDLTDRGVTATARFVRQVTHSRARYVRSVRKAFEPLRVNIGSGGLSYPGWIASDVPQEPGYLPAVAELGRMALPLDVTQRDDWDRAFDEGTIANLLSEHVFEHLSDADIETALALAHAYLAPGGRFRIAVPDGHRPDARYIAGVRPPADGHRQLFTLDDLTGRLLKAGFRVEPIEWYDAAGVFNRRAYDERDGVVLRSYGRDRQADFAHADHFYTSIIVDAFKGAA